MASDNAKKPHDVGKRLVEVTRKLADTVDRLEFRGKVAHVYNPLRYARIPHENYVKRYGTQRGTTLMLGMNPGPWGMAQTGVPFGEVSLVRSWLELDGTVERPEHEHPKRPILGWNCRRSEVSGARLWGWARERFVSPEAFFAKFFVWNYCPLCFMYETGANCTPDKLLREERDALFAVCDQALVEVVEAIEPRLVVGIGGFAQKRAAEALAGRDIKVASILHPSPASPAANRGWAEKVEAQLHEVGAL